MLNRLFRYFFPQKNPFYIKKKYGIPNTISLNIELRDGWYTAAIPELPGLFTQAKSQEELLDMVNDAVLTYFDVPKRESDFVFDQLKIGDEVVRYNAQLKTA